MRAQMYWDGTTRFIHGFLAPGSGIGEHTHSGNCEMIFVVRGEGTVTYDGVESPIKAGQCSYCPEGHSHSMKNTGIDTLEIYATVPKQ